MYDKKQAYYMFIIGGDIIRGKAIFYQNQM